MRRHVCRVCWTVTILMNLLRTVNPAAIPKPPNILFFMGDDLGYNDVSFHGSNQIPTPNIDALCYGGVNLNRYYVTPTCTPSRISMMSGKYAFTSGHGELVLFAAETRGYNLNVTLMPQHLKKLGYKTHLVGKWHIGNYKAEYTPTHRGFDSHLGCWTGHIDYYEHTSLDRNPNIFENQSIQWLGYDMRRNLDVAWDLQGKYSTDIFTQEAVRLIQEHDTSKPLYLQVAHTAPHAGNIWDPLQAPAEVVANFLDIQDEKRRTYAAMVAKLDTSLGIIMETLDKAGMLDNTIVVFTTDNGGTNDPSEGDEGSNWPLRGMKNTMWEGGVRGAGCMWSPLLRRQGVIYDELMQATDWLPTLYTAAGGDVADLGEIDGFSQWNAINSDDHKSPRTELLVHADRIQGISAYIDGDWKLVNGGSLLNMNDGWYGATGRDADYAYNPEWILNSSTALAIAKHGNGMGSVEDITKKRRNVTLECRPPQSSVTSCAPCLFNLRQDPCETTNLASQYPSVVDTLLDRIAYYKSIAAPSQNTGFDLRAYPDNWNGTWTYFGDFFQIA